MYITLVSDGHRHKGLVEESGDSIYRCITRAIKLYFWKQKFKWTLGVKLELVWVYSISLFFFTAQNTCTCNLKYRHHNFFFTNNLVGIFETFIRRYPILKGKNTSRPSLP